MILVALGHNQNKGYTCCVTSIELPAAATPRFLFGQTQPSRESQTPALKPSQTSYIPLHSGYLVMPPCWADSNFQWPQADHSSQDLEDQQAWPTLLLRQSPISAFPSKHLEDLEAWLTLSSQKSPTNASSSKTAPEEPPKKCLSNTTLAKLEEAKTNLNAPFPMAMRLCQHQRRVYFIAPSPS